MARRGQPFQVVTQVVSEVARGAPLERGKAGDGHAGELGQPLPQDLPRIPRRSSYAVGADLLHGRSLASHHQERVGGQKGVSTQAPEARRALQKDAVGHVGESRAGFERNGRRPNFLDSGLDHAVPLGWPGRRDLLERWVSVTCSSAGSSGGVKYPQFSVPSCR